MKEGKVFKRILAIALVVVMTITMMPFGVFANGTEGTGDATEAPHAHAWVNGVCECGVACDHADKVRTDEIKATCIATGHKSYFTCNTCGSIIRAGEITTLENIAYAIDPNNHAGEAKEKAGTAIPATCTTPGKEADLVYECCGVTKTEGAATSMIPHSVDGVTVLTIVDNDYHGKKCNGVGCNEILAREAHDWGEGVVTTAPTCVEKGVTTFTCACGATKTGEIPATGEHNYTIEVADSKVDATCTTEGHVTKKCACGAENEETIAIVATAHNWGGWTVVTPAKCGVAGSEERVCSYNNAHKDTKEIAALDHIFVNGVCTREGCGTNCVHAWENGKCTKCKITCQHTGGTATCIEKATCTICGEKYGEFDADNHALTVTETVGAEAATCTKAGKTGDEIYKCCDAVKTPSTEIPMLPHSYTVEVEASKVAATCSTKGSIDMKCANCTAIDPNKKELAIDPDNHEGYTTEVPGTKKEATCVATGEVMMECACGAREKKILDIVATAHNIEGVTVTKKDADKHGKKCANEGCTAWVGEADHAYTETVSKTLPNCVTEGSETKKCVCGDTKTETLPADETHDWGVWTETLAPTCTTAGSKERPCKRTGCTDKDTAVVDALGHNMKEVAAKEATCKEDGNNKYYACDRCEKFFKDIEGKIETSVAAETIAKGEHKFTKYNVVKDATCTANAIEKATCDICEEATHERGMPGTMIAHSFKDYKSDGNATCKVDGTMTAVCEICKEAKDTKTEVDSHKTAPHTPDTAGVKCTLCGAELVCLHTYSGEKLITKTPTCTEKGQKANVCSKCNANKPGSEEEIAATGHAWDEGEIIKDATCKEKGSKKFKCNNKCGETKTEEIAVKPHNYKEEITHATCTEAGYSTFTCTMCGSHYVDKPVEAYGHMFETYFYDEGSATCYQDGTKTAECANGCGTKNTVADPGSKTDHEMTDFTVITPATCTEDGEEEAKCFYHEKCGYSELIPVEALGHDDSGEFVETKAATCTEKGEKQKTCTRCPEIVATEEIPALGHDETAEFEVTVAPTCTEKGTQVKKCKTCSEVIATEEVAALGHDIAADYTIDVPATCTTEGSQSKHCSRCDYKDGVVAIPASGHDMQPGEGTTATCTEPGKAVFVCANGCGKTHEEANVPALGHSFTYTSNGDATCQADGTKTGKCIRCDVTETVPDEGSMLEHVFGEPVIEKASTEKGGLVTTKCTNCEYEEVEEIAMIDSLKLKYETVVYDGKYKRPSLTITDAEGAKLIKGEDYLLELPEKDECINAGTYTYTVTFIGNYEGETTLTYKVVPGKASKIVSKGTKQTYIDLKWSTVKGADGYRIYVKTSSGGWKKLATVKGKTTYRVKDLKAGTNYTFAVKAFSKAADGETTIWATEFAEQAFKTLPGKTSKLTAKTSKNAVKLTWKEVKGAEGYRVYVKTAKGGWKTVATVKGGKVTYTVKGLKTNTTYEYAVKAFYKDGSATVWSNQYTTVKAKTAK